MLIDEVRQLEEIFTGARTHLEHELEGASEDAEEIRELLQSFIRIEKAMQDDKSRQLVQDVMKAFFFLDQSAQDADIEDEEFDDEMDE